MNNSFSIEALAQRVNAWCEEHEIVPASGQSGETVTERNIRYYRTLGLVDAPGDDGYTEKHLLQLSAIRLLQAQGVPLRRIRELLYGRAIEELREIRRRGLVESTKIAATIRIAPPAEDELWRTIPIDDDFLLISRRGTPLTPVQREAVRQALHSFSPTNPASPTSKPRR